MHVFKDILDRIVFRAQALMPIVGKIKTNLTLTPTIDMIVTCH